MRYLLALILFLSLCFPAAAQINKAEYYLDADPGIGKGTVIPVTPGNNITSTFNIPLKNAVQGVHNLYTRVRDQHGRWSLTSSQTFFVNELIIKGSLVSKAEYFLDKDPGFGKAVPIQLTAGSNITAKFTVPLTNAAAGVHILYTRTQDDHGKWSLTSSQTFFVNSLSIKDRVLVKAEYYIDSDPGTGKGTAVTIAGSKTTADVNFKVDLTKQSDGLHTIYVRVLDSKGSWSLTNQQIFYVHSSSIENIVSLEYSFTNPGFSSKTYIYKVPAPSPSVALDFKEQLTDLVADKAYNMSIYAVTASGMRSLAQTRTIKVCSGKKPSAAFDFVQSGTNVNFSAKDTSGIKYQWDFGDGTKDTLGTVYHTYKGVGAFSARLITSNVCYSDTLIQLLNIKGITSINTSHGGNTGQLTADINGAGFVNGTKILLSKNGSTITGQNLVFHDLGKVTATFDLTGKDIGQYDVIAILPNNEQDTLHKGFTVENGSPQNLSVNLAGDYVIRVGFNQVYTLTYTNHGNTDVSFVPILVSGLPLGTDIELVEPTFDISSITGFTNAKSLLDTTNATVQDSAANSAFRVLFLNKIPANSSGTLHFIFHLPLDAHLHTYPNVDVVIGEGITDALQPTSESVKANVLQIDKPKALNSLNSFLKNHGECISSMLKAGVEIADLIFQVNDKQQCALDIEDNVLSVIDHFVSSSNEVIDYKKLALAAVETTSQCGLAFLPVKKIKSLYKAADISLKIAKKHIKTAKNFLEDANHFFDGFEDGQLAHEVVNNCSESFKQAYEYVITKIVGNATDPNDKYGSGDTSIFHYTNNRLLNYIVNFENEPSANLNAQTVTVVDTIGKSFNRSTFGFTSVILGDSIFTFSPTKSFIHDFSMASKYGVNVRVVAQFDTITGVAQWKFLSIDPISNQITSNALAGFLPPDRLSPEGQGYVGYQVEANYEKTTGDKVQNQAFITFDYNPVIPTKIWNNTFDFQPPVSKVTALPAITSDTTFTVDWNGKDNLSGISRYSIYYAVNKGAYRPWIDGTTQNSAVFTGHPDSTYTFYSIAFDKAGNIEGNKNVGEATTTVKEGKQQTIKFPAIVQKTFGDPDFDPAATASSGLQVTYTSSNTGIITVVNGKLHIVGAGSVIITANQSGNDVFSSATPVYDTLQIKKAIQTITFPVIPAKDYTTADFDGGASSNSGLPINYISLTPSVLTIVNGKIHIVAPGKGTIVAIQTGNANYLADTTSQSIQINFSLPSDNFKISAIGESCRNSNNGEIHITAITKQNYTVNITGAVTKNYSLTDSLSVQNLPPGTYSVCITISDYPGYKQCSDVVITQPADLSVYTAVNNNNASLNLHLSGGSSYQITINKMVYTTTQSDITLPLNDGENDVKITTASLCQGVFEKVINMPVGLLAYPNPFDKILNLSITHDTSKTALVEVRNIAGALVFSGRERVDNGVLSIDLSALKSGSYGVKVTLDHSEKYIKIIKK